MTYNVFGGTLNPAQLNSTRPDLDVKDFTEAQLRDRDTLTGSGRI